MSATLAIARQSFDPRVIGGMHLWLSGEINGNAGTTWTDLSGSGNNGTLTNGPTFSTDNGGTIVFDGVNDYVSVSSLTEVTFGQAWTLAAWFKPTGAQSSRGILAIQGVLNSNGPRLLLQRQDSTNARWYLAGNYRITETVSDNVYTHLALTYDGTIYRSYKNGSAGGTYTGTFTSTNSSNYLWLANGFNGYMSGSFGDVTVHKSTLSASAVAALYQRSRFRYA